MSFKSKLGSVLFWSVISAAFIGPGTVATAASAGVTYNLNLVWVLVFATFACVVLQEAASRITIGSGLTLGQAVAKRLGSDKWKITLGLAVIFGCAAYEAGNLLGAVAGFSLLHDGYEKLALISLFLTSGVLLWFGNIRFLVRLLGIVVAFMGLLFIWLALQTDVQIIDFISSAVTPTMPSGSSLLIVGLLGTTIVPYNFFLGSGISVGQSLNEMRFGLTVAVLIGGAISIAILVVSSEVSGEMSFSTIYHSISLNMGGFTAGFFAFGLFAAGATSTLTAPLASAVTAKSLFATPGKNWEEDGWRYKTVWILVLGFGFIIGIAGFKPIPVIILAQAINGFLLPFIVIFLFLIVNDSTLMSEKTLNGMKGNISMFFIMVLTIFLGLNNVAKVLNVLLEVELSQVFTLIISFLFSIVTMYYALRDRV